MWRKRRKTLLVISGILYLAFGILAFFDIPGGHDQHHHTFAHNLTHLILGLVLLGITLKTRPATRQKLCFVVASLYFVIGLLGIVSGSHASLQIIPGIVEFHAGDYAVHLATGLFFLALGCFKRSDRRPPPPAKPHVPEPNLVTNSKQSLR